MSKRRAIIPPKPLPSPKPTVLERLLSLPRWWRIILASGVAVIVILVISPLVDSIYLQRFYDPNTTLVPSLVSSTLGVGMYLWGWSLFVGWRGSQSQPRRLSFALYCVVAFVSLALALGLILFGLSSMNTPTGIQ